MKHIRYIFAWLPIVLAGCTVTYDHHYPEVAERYARTYECPRHFQSPDASRIETVKQNLDYLQPYMTQDECWKTLDLPNRDVSHFGFGRASGFYHYYDIA